MILKSSHRHLRFSDGCQLSFWDSVGFSSSQICGCLGGLFVVCLVVFCLFVCFFPPVFDLQHFSPTNVCPSYNEDMVIYNFCHLMIKMVDLVLNVHENTHLQTNCLFSWFYCNQRQWNMLSYSKQKHLAHVAAVTAILRYYSKNMGNWISLN